jgi:transcriptional regulator with XRE-family HTH domain
MTEPQLVGKNVKGYREKLGLSQEALADIAGVHRTYINQVEQGRMNISVINIFKIAKALKIEANLLLIQDSWKKKGQ